MAQAEASNVTASCGGDAGGTLLVTEVYSSVAGDEYVTPSASTSSASDSTKYVTAGMSEEQIRDATETSREQGWSELTEHSAHDGTAASSSHAQQMTRVLWEELKKSYPYIFKETYEDELKLGRLIAEGGQAQIFEASLNGADHSSLVAKVFKMEGFSLADLQRQWPRLQLSSLE